MTYRNTQFIKNSTEPLHLARHLLSALVPETVLLCLTEPDRHGFLQWGHAGEADPRVCCRDVLDEVLGAHEEADAPARGVEVLAGGADGDGSGGEFGGEGRDAGEGDVVETVVNLIELSVG